MTNAPVERASHINLQCRLGKVDLIPIGDRGAFTLAEAAAMAIIGYRIAMFGDFGYCTLPLPIIARRAFCSVTSVRRALRSGVERNLIDPSTWTKTKRPSVLMIGPTVFWGDYLMNWAIHPWYAEGRGDMVAFDAMALDDVP